jgi:hypothetical protein
MELTESASEVTDFTRQCVVVIVKCAREYVGERNVATNRSVTLYGSGVSRHDLLFSSEKYRQALALRPGVVTSLHGLVLVSLLVLVGDCALKEVRVVLGKTNPFRLPLKEAEVAARSRPPRVVGG